VEACKKPFCWEAYGVANLAPEFAAVSLTTDGPQKGGISDSLER